MKKILIADKTLNRAESSFSFREKIEIVRHLENLKVDVIELPEIIEEKVDALLVKTVASFVKNGIISVGAGVNLSSVDNAINTLSSVKNSRVRIELPVSPVGLEYVCGKKPAKIGEYLQACVEKCVQAGLDVEFSAKDAFRADFDLLLSLIDIAVKAGVKTISISEDSGETLPDDFVVFTQKIKAVLPENVKLAISANDKNGLANAHGIMAVRSGADVIKTCVSGDDIKLKVFAGMLYSCGNTFGVSASIKSTEIKRTVNQIEKITGGVESGASVQAYSTENEINLIGSDDIKTVEQAVISLGYDLTDDDINKVYDEFKKVASKKQVGAKELDAIVSTVAMQVPDTYKLISYVINNGNIITTSASVTLEKDDKNLQAVCLGDGPIDAAFKAIDEIIGHHFELDNFSIKSVTEGKGAVGSALVKLRNKGKIYSGSGISTDIIGASIKAYVNAVNKISYEEE